jgi:hypothetical protein
MNGMTKHIRDAFDLANTDKGYYHNYEYMYANIFANFIPDSMLEIGVKNGNSILAWQQLFPKANITGIDITERNLVTKLPFNYLIGSSTTFDVSTLDNFDVIVEDGSHRVEDQIETFKNFKNKFNYYYIVEDVNFVKDNDVNSDRPVRMLTEAIQAEGFYGISTFMSYNKRKHTRSLVIMSKNF